MPSFPPSDLCFTLFLLQKVAWGYSPAFPLCFMVLRPQVSMLCLFTFVHFCIFVFFILIELFCLCLLLLTTVMELLNFLHLHKMCLELFQSSLVSRHRARSWTRKFLDSNSHFLSILNHQYVSTCFSTCARPLSSLIVSQGHSNHQARDCLPIPLFHGL